MQLAWCRVSECDVLVRRTILIVYWHGMLTMWRRWSNVPLHVIIICVPACLWDLMRHSLRVWLLQVLTLMLLIISRHLNPSFGTCVVFSQCWIPCFCVALRRWDCRNGHCGECRSRCGRLNTLRHRYFRRPLKTSSNCMRYQFILILDKHLWSYMEAKIDSKKEFDFKTVHFRDEDAANLGIIRVIIMHRRKIWRQAKLQ